MANSLTIASYIESFRLLISLWVFRFAISQLLKNSLSNFSTTVNHECGMKQQSANSSKQNQSRETDIKYRLKFFALILPKIHKIHNTSYIYICMENLDFLSSANVTDVLSSDNGSCKWRKRGGGGQEYRLFSYTAKNTGESTLWEHVRVREDELVRGKFTMGDRSVMFCRWQWSWMQRPFPYKETRMRRTIVTFHTTSGLKLT